MCSDLVSWLLCYVLFCSTPTAGTQQVEVKGPTVASDLGWIFQFCLPEAPHLGDSLELCVTQRRSDLTLSAWFEKMSKEVWVWEMLGLLPSSYSHQKHPHLSKNALVGRWGGVGEDGRWGRRGSMRCPHSGGDRRTVGIRARKEGLQSLAVFMGCHFPLDPASHPSYPLHFQKVVLKCSLQIFPPSTGSWLTHL